MSKKFRLMSIFLAAICSNSFINVNRIVMADNSENIEIENQDLQNTDINDLESEIIPSEKNDALIENEADSKESINIENDVPDASTNDLLEIQDDSLENNISDITETDKQEPDESQLESCDQNQEVENLEESASIDDSVETYDSSNLVIWGDDASYISSNNQCTINNIKFNLNNVNSTASISSCRTAAICADLILPEQVKVDGKCYTVTRIEDDAFYYCRNLVSINIPETITSIGENVFYYCDSLKNVKLPHSLNIISYGMFSCCSSLTEIEIPEGVTTIDTYAFSNCTNLNSIMVPDSLTTVKDRSFWKCGKLRMVWGSYNGFGKIRYKLDYYPQFIQTNIYYGYKEGPIQLSSNFNMRCFEICSDGTEKEVPLIINDSSSNKTYTHDPDKTAIGTRTYYYQVAAYDGIYKSPAIDVQVTEKSEGFKIIK